MATMWLYVRARDLYGLRLPPAQAVVRGRPRGEARVQIPGDQELSARERDCDATGSNAAPSGSANTSGTSRRPRIVYEYIRLLLEIAGRGLRALPGGAVDRERSVEVAGQGLEACRQVRGVADRAPDEPVRGPDVAHERLAGGDADADGDRLPERGEGVEDRPARRDGRPLLVWKRTGGAEHRHHPVAVELDDRAAVARHHLRHEPGVAVQGREDVLEGPLLGQPRVAAHVDEQDRRPRGAR